MMMVVSGVTMIAVRIFIPSFLVDFKDIGVPATISSLNRDSVPLL